MSTTTASTTSAQSLLTLLQNSSLHETLISTVLALQSPDTPKTQSRISSLVKDVKGDALKVAGEEACVIGERVFQDDNEAQITQFKHMMDLIRKTQQAEARNERKLRLQRGAQRNDTTEMQWYTNLTNEAAYWNLVGIKLHDAPLVQKSLALFKLSHAHLRHIRFVGKFFGLERNYFVIETDHDGDEDLSEEELAAFAPGTTADSNQAKYRVRFGSTEQPAERPAERSTTNHYRYWVCTSGESLTQSNWVRLPDVTPAQILTAKRIKKYLTGRLNAPVNSYPQFPGSEANYLRAQIARIVAATTIAPRGLYKLWTAPEEEEDDEDAPKKPVVPPVSDLVLSSAGGEEEEEEDEEGGLNVKTLQKPDSWVHLYPVILDVGRATEYKPLKIKTGEDDEEEEEEEEEDTNKVPRLRALASDAGLQLPDYLQPLEKPKKTGDDEEEEPEEEEEEGEEGALKKGQYAPWSFQAFGELDEPSAVVLAQSLRWPGAFAFACENGKKAGTIYIGDGLKAEGDLNVFTPVIPEPIEQDAAEPKQQEDPTVSNEKRVRDFGEEPLKDEAEEEGEGEEED